MRANTPEALPSAASSPTFVRRFVASLPFAGVLFAVWAVLSQKFDAVHLSVGATTALVIAAISYRLAMQPPPIGGEPLRPFAGNVSWIKLVGYLPWIIWQVVLSALHVARVVLDPRLPIAPRVFRVRGGLPHNFARLTLANSITLTPGTVTLDVEGDEFTVHALTAAAAGSLEDDSFQRRVRRLFEEPGAREAS